MNTSTNHIMQCMEVWGGNRAVDNGVMMPGLDAWVFSRPYAGPGSVGAASGSDRGGSGGGGDIHYVTSCATGRVTRLTVADVSGHGESVSKAAEHLRRLMRKYSNYVDQTKFVEALNRQFGMLAEEASAAGEETGAVFATAVVATYFAPTDDLSICNAGHPRPLRFDAKKGIWSALLSDDAEGVGPANLPLGVVEPTRYPKMTLRLGRNDLVLFYTDSFIEARDAEGRMLGQKGLLRLIEGVDPSRPDVFIAELIERINSAGGGAGGGSKGSVFDDDVTALLVRRNDLKPRPGIKLALMAGVRIIAESVKGLAERRMPMPLPERGIRSLGGAFLQRLNGRGEKG